MDGPRERRTPAPPFIKIGRSVRYLKEDLDAWLDRFHKLECIGQLPCVSSQCEEESDSYQDSK